MSIKTFLSTAVCFLMAGNAVLGQSPSAKPLYELRSYVSESGRQADVLKLFSDSGIPMMVFPSLILALYGQAQDNIGWSLDQCRPKG